MMRLVYLIVIALGFSLTLLACTTTSPAREVEPTEGPEETALEEITSEEQLSRQPNLESDNEQDRPSYRILKQGSHKRDNWLRLNEYFLIHHLYTDIFHRFGLHDRFSLEDKIRIFATLLYNLDFSSPVNLAIDNYNQEGSLVVSLQLIHIGNQRGVLLATNTDPDGRKIFVGAENIAKTYKCTYVIVEDQLIALSDLYSEKKETRLIEENHAEELAHFYIFDGNSSNDKVAEGLLIGSIRQAGSLLERSHSELTLCRYYMSRNRLVEAQALLLAVGSQLIHAEENPALSTLTDRYFTAYEELLITHALKEHEQQLQENRPKSL
jgi:hypothetical protein